MKQWRQVGRTLLLHDDVIKWKHFSRYWPFVRGIHRSQVNSPHKGQCGGALMFSLICAWTHGWVNNRKASELRRHRAHYDVTVMWTNDNTIIICCIELKKIAFDVPKLISLNLEMIEVYDLLFITIIFEYNLSWFPCLWRTNLERWTRLSSAQYILARLSISSS